MSKNKIDKMDIQDITPEIEQEWLDDINKIVGSKFSTKPTYNRNHYIYINPDDAFKHSVTTYINVYGEDDAKHIGNTMTRYFRNINMKAMNNHSPMRKKCKRSQKLNRKTSRCRKTPCAKGETRDVSSRRCRKKKCSPRKTRDVTSHRCRKKKSPGRKSPKRKSPSRKSPKRKSPSRKSPSRKSPKRKSPTKKSRK